MAGGEPARGEAEPARKDVPPPRPSRPETAPHQYRRSVDRLVAAWRLPCAHAGGNREAEDRLRRMARAGKETAQWGPAGALKAASRSAPRQGTSGRLSGDEVSPPGRDWGARSFPSAP